MMASRRESLHGVAGAVLPIALFGLLVISLMVASALLTASSELVLSRAYQDGLRSLHDADAALESFISTAEVPGDTPQGETRKSGATSPDGERFEVGLTLLRNGAVEEDTTGKLSRRDLFSIVAQPADGRGRIAGALLETVRATSPFRTAIDAAVTVGGDATIGLEATLAALPQGESGCARAVAPIALRVGAAGLVNGSGATALPGGVQQDSSASTALVERTLSGASVAEISAGATAYFGPAYSRPAFVTHNGPRHDAALVDYRWGCPVSLVFACPQDAAGQNMVVVIDAAGGEIDLDGGYGQGALIVRNGGARLSGTFRFAGLILVEGQLRLEGAAQIMGAAVVTDDLILGSSGVPSGEGPGIVFDACSLSAAERALSIARLKTAPQTLDSPTFGWYEVVR